MSTLWVLWIVAPIAWCYKRRKQFVASATYAYMYMLCRRLPHEHTVHPVSSICLTHGACGYSTSYAKLWVHDNMVHVQSLHTWCSLVQCLGRRWTIKGIGWYKGAVCQRFKQSGLHLWKGTQSGTHDSSVSIHEEQAQQIITPTEQHNGYHAVNVSHVECSWSIYGLYWQHCHCHSVSP